VVALAFPLTALLLAAPGSAMADVIDGDWCFARAAVRDPRAEYRDPAGSGTTGDYSATISAMSCPESDPDAGKTIDMRLMNENAVFLWLGGQAMVRNASPSRHRCLPAVS
jgi:hypothetical protein